MILTVKRCRQRALHNTSSPLNQAPMFSTIAPFRAVFAFFARSALPSLQIGTGGIAFTFSAREAAPIGAPLCTDASLSRLLFPSRHPLFPSPLSPISKQVHGSMQRSTKTVTTRKQLRERRKLLQEQLESCSRKYQNFVQEKTRERETAKRQRALDEQQARTAHKYRDMQKRLAEVREQTEQRHQQRMKTVDDMAQELTRRRDEPTRAPEQASEIPAPCTKAGCTVPMRAGALRAEVDEHRRKRARWSRDAEAPTMRSEETRCEDGREERVQGLLEEAREIARIREVMQGKRRESARKTRQLLAETAQQRQRDQQRLRRVRQAALDAQRQGDVITTLFWQELHDNKKRKRAAAESEAGADEASPCGVGVSGPSPSSTSCVAGGGAFAESGGGEGCEAGREERTRTGRARRWDFSGGSSAEARAWALRRAEARTRQAKSDRQHAARRHRSLAQSRAPAT